MRKVKLLATLRDMAGTSSVEIPLQPGDTARDLVNAMREICPPIAQEMVDEHGELTGLVHIFVNGRNIVWINGLETEIKESDTLALIPPTAGG